MQVSFNLCSTPDYIQDKFEGFKIHFLNAAKKGDLEELSQLLEGFEKHLEKELDYRYYNIITQATETLLENKENVIEEKSFERLALALSNALKIAALNILINSERTENLLGSLSTDALTTILLKTCETGRCQTNIICRILRLENAQDISAQNLGKALESIYQLNDAFTASLILHSPIHKNICAEDFVKAFILSFNWQTGCDEPLRLWKSISDSKTLALMHDAALTQYRSNGVKLCELLKITLECISLPCLESTFKYMIEARRLMALEFILCSSRAKEISPSCYQEALKISAMTYEFGGMKKLIFSPIAVKHFLAKDLAFALSFITIPKTGAIDHHTLATLVTTILKLPEAEKLTCKELDNFYNKAFESQSEPLVMAILLSDVWQGLHP